MEKKRIIKIPHSKKEQIGLATGLLNENCVEIKTGDSIKLKNAGYTGVVLWNRELNCFGLFFGLWYGDKNPYNPDCYGKFISIPKDQGMRMELIPVTKQDLAVIT